MLLKVQTQSLDLTLLEIAIAVTLQQIRIAFGVAQGIFYKRIVLWGLGDNLDIINDVNVCERGNVNVNVNLECNNCHVNVNWLYMYLSRISVIPVFRAFLLAILCKLSIANSKQNTRTQ